MTFNQEKELEFKTIIKVVGVGGGGVNAINRMIDNEVGGVEFIALNTDTKSLRSSKADVRITLGKTLLRGLGAGGKPEVGRQAALESESEIKERLKGAHLVIVCTGLGGGTGTYAIGEVARMSRELGALTVGVVTTPFEFEGPRRIADAKSGVEELKQFCDTLIVIPNQKLFELPGFSEELLNAFRLADNVLRECIQGITEIINAPGLIALDFKDVESALQNKGTALIGIGSAKGPNRTIAAVRKAIESPLLDVSLNGAEHIIFNITTNQQITITEYNEVTSEIRRIAGEHVHIVPGIIINRDLVDEVIVTIIATGTQLNPTTNPSTEITNEAIGGSKPDDNYQLEGKKDRPKVNVPDWLKNKK